MKKILIYFLCVFCMLPAVAAARIGIFDCVGAGPLYYGVGDNIEIQIYNFAFGIGYGNWPPQDFFLFNKGKIAYELKAYADSLESSPCAALQFSPNFGIAAGLNPDGSYFSRWAPALTFLLGYRWLFENLIFGQQGAKFCLGFSFGLLYIINTGNGSIINPTSNTILPMIEISAGSGWIFTPWEK